MRYNIENEALIGACFLPAGLGSMRKLSYSSLHWGCPNYLDLVGAPLSGRLSDQIIVYYRKKRGSVWYPEDRLRAALPGALILVPLSILISAILTEYVPGTLGLMLNFVCLFANGLGVIFYFFFISHSVCSFSLLG